MKVLIILNQQPFIPAFMLTALHSAQTSFDQIYYVNTTSLSNKKDLGRDDKITFVAPGKGARLLALARALPGLFSPVVYRDVLKCVKEKGLSVRTIRQFVVEQYVHYRLFPLAARFIKNHPERENLTVLSTWFAACAFTAAELKARFPAVKAVSLAHSYEILPIRNPYVRFMHYAYKHQRLDGVFFISRKVREMYLEGIGGLPEDLEMKTDVSYLGSFKESERLNISQSGVFHLCSCSRVVPLKRLGLLLDALEDWDLCPVRWTHLGDGPLLPEIRERVKAVCEKNPLVEIRLKGRVPNEEVKRFYATEPVDLFVNLSEIEGLPVSIMEAISYGIPVLATDVGGTGEIVTPQTGFLLPPSLTGLSVRDGLSLFFRLPESRKAELRKSSFLFWDSHFNASVNLNCLFEKINRIHS